MRRLPLLAAVVAPLAFSLPAPAGAPITASTIDPPATGPTVIFLVHTGAMLTAHVTGAVDGDKVDVDCVGVTVFSHNGPGYAVDAAQGTVAIPLDDLNYNFCPFRVIPHGAG